MPKIKHGVKVTEDSAPGLGPDYVPFSVRNATPETCKAYRDRALAAEAKLRALDDFKPCGCGWTDKKTYTECSDHASIRKELEHEKQRSRHFKGLVRDFHEAALHYARIAPKLTDDGAGTYIEIYGYKITVRMYSTNPLKPGEKPTFCTRDLKITVERSTVTDVS